MKVLGIVAEYNPFHNGHEYQIQQAKKMTGADKVIVVMSGNFMQRGTPAVIHKYARTKMALSHGVDLIIELPLYYACASAEYFAKGAVSLLDQLGVVDYLAFGSECGDIDLLTKIARVLIDPSEAFEERVKAYSKEGNTYPKARSLALLEHFSNGIHFQAEKSMEIMPSDERSKLEQILTSPNNILGIEYIKALLSRSSKITPVTIKRLGGSYHAEDLTTLHSSANAIRTALHHAGTNSSGTVPAPNDSVTHSMPAATMAFHHVQESLRSQVPAVTYDLLCVNFQKCFPIFSDDLSALLQYKLTLEYTRGYDAYVDVSSDLSDRIRNKLPEYQDYEQFCGILKSKDMTYTRISRCLLHILLNITRDNLQRYLSCNPTPYARMLGFRRDSSELLSAIKKKSTLPLLSKLADAEKVLSQSCDSPYGVEMLQEEINASHIYNALISQKFHGAVKNEYEQPMIVL
ncbi:MAG: nucleotidyltransferase [Lachnospiraceae bacterium]|nr:nucleotidyltransferase [Lachnospiraceae bacterium]